jgi:hypothetical protein
MDPDDIKVINDIYIKTLKKGRNTYELSNVEHNTIQHAQELESYSTYLHEMNYKLYHILEISDKYADECFNKATEIREYVHLHDKYKNEEYPVFSVHKTMFKNSKWCDIMDDDDKINNILSNVKDITDQNKDLCTEKQTIYKNIKDLYTHKINFDWNIPIINRLSEIPQSLYWYKGDKNNDEGIYTCLSDGFCVQIPFPNTVDGTKDFNRICSIKCKYKTIDECLKIRQELSNKFNSDVRICNFAHTGEKYTKIGTSFRCPNIPRFGNHTFLNEDLNTLPDYDMKMMLMYSLSDVLLGSMWFQQQKRKKITLTNIDTC